MKPNKLRELLTAGRPTLGTRVHSPWPNVVEAIGHTGMFDYVEFVAEYASFDLFTLENLCRAAELYGLGAMIKIDQEPRTFLAQRAIGCGFGSVLFTDCRSADDARACVRSVRPDTPEDCGTHGVAVRRAAYMREAGTPQYVQSLRDVVVAFMAEKLSFVDTLEESVSVGGVDMVVWGPADYCMSSGRAGAWLHGDPEVKAVERRVIETCLRLGIPPRAEIESLDAARYYLDLGVRHFSIGTDLMVLFRWMKENGEGMRRLFETI